MPSQNGRACWNPAVPPPPVAGAAVGNGLSDGLGDGDGVALGLGVVTLGLCVVALALGVAVPVAEVVAVAEPVPPGDNVGGVAEGVPVEQPETDAGASMAKVAQPAAISLALGAVPTIVVRILWDRHKSKARGRFRHAMACSTL